MADSEEKLFRLVSEYGTACEIRKLRVNVGKSKVMRFSKNVNGGRMYVRRNDETLEEVDYIKYVAAQVSADGGCNWDDVHRMNEGYKAWER